MHLVDDKDVIILASDGIFDNIFDEDILKCLSYRNWDRGSIEDSDAEQAAICLAEKASLLSKDQEYDSPFAQHAKKYNKNEPGGKVDDITVIVAQVKFIN